MLPVRVGLEGVKGVRTVPESVPLPFEAREDYTEFVVPEVRGHAVVEIAL